MKSKIIFSLVAFAAIFLSACQKDFTVETTTARVDSTITPTTSDSVYLDRYYYIEINSSGANGLDTGIRTHYQYDNLKRVKIICDTINEPFFSAIKTYEKIEYFYNGNDTLPNKRISYWYKYSSVPALPGSRDTAVSFYTYNINGKIILDSTIESGLTFPSTNHLHKYINNFSYSGNKIISLMQKTNLLSTTGLGLERLHRDTLTLDAIGNVTSSKIQSVYFYPSNSSNYTANNFTYDNKQSPVSKQNIKQFYNYFYNRNIDLPIRFGFTPYNNIVSSQEVNGPIVNGNFANSISYNAKGFPFLLLLNYPVTPTNFFPYSDKFTFIYKAL